MVRSLRAPRTSRPKRLPVKRIVHALQTKTLMNRRTNESQQVSHRLKYFSPRLVGERKVVDGRCELLLLERRHRRPVVRKHALQNRRMLLVWNSQKNSFNQMCKVRLWLGCRRDWNLSGRLGDRARRGVVRKARLEDSSRELSLESREV